MKIKYGDVAKEEGSQTLDILLLKDWS